MNDIRVWFASLIAAIIGGAANGVLAMGVAPEVFNFHAGLGKLGAMAGGSAIVAAAMFLKQSPLPASLLSTTVTQTESVTKSPGVVTTKQVTKTETTETPKETPKEI
jgi:hypothetical protein